MVVEATVRSAWGLGSHWLMCFWRESPYVYIVLSPISTWCFNGRTEMSFDSMKGIPTRTSISRFYITSPSTKKEYDYQEKCKVVSPTTFKGEQPSAGWANWFVGGDFSTQASDCWCSDHVASSSRVNSLAYIGVLMEEVQIWWLSNGHTLAN